MALPRNTIAVTAATGWTIGPSTTGWQFAGGEGLDQAYVPFFGAFGAARDDAMVARWSANPLGMRRSQMDPVSGGDYRAIVGRDVRVYERS